MAGFPCSAAVGATQARPDAPGHAAAAAEIARLRETARQMVGVLQRSLPHLPHGATIRRDALAAIARAEALR